MGKSKNISFYSSLSVLTDIGRFRILGQHNISGRFALFAVLLLSLAALLAFSGCGTSQDAGFKRVGIYNNKNGRTDYRFEKHSTATKLVSDLQTNDFEAKVQEIKFNDKNNGKTVAAYEVYARPKAPSIKSIGWPKGSDRHIVEYIGTLQKAGNITWDGLPDKNNETWLRRIFGDRSSGVSPINHPCFMASGHGDEIYVSSQNGITIYNTKEKTIRALRFHIAHPGDIAIGQDGKVYIADIDRGSVFVLRNGKLVDTIGHPPELKAPYGLALDENMERLYVTDILNHAVLAYSLRGELLFTIGSSSLPNSFMPQFGAPVDVAVNSLGDIYFTDQSAARILHFNKNGEYAGSFSGCGIRPGSLVRPKGIAVDSADNVYVVDAAMENVQIFDSEGRLLLVFGGGGTKLGKFTMPHGIYISKDDTIFVADMGLNRVQVFRFFKDRVNTILADGETK